MSLTTPIIDIKSLRLSTRKPDIEDDDETANWVLEESSGLICDTANHPEWEEFDFEGEVPRTAKRIALAVATRVYNNPEFEIASSIGPLSSRHLDLYALGFNLSDTEQARLEDLRGSSAGGGLGILTLAGNTSVDLVTYLPPAPSADSDSIGYYAPGGVGSP